ncbi:hypothetical protein GCM10010313_75670 [Streptomyces violarus]|uniref:Secreted protein n=1 Tax=Streptomyces violarus TaxID=67380 RepID=A0A7W4ZPX6_9ACTN|nr:MULTISPECIES: hypothetical protein [Streptomyces]MBB3076539.1 hypothetical protein [Streptomyces violarus]WRT99335.1 hypothetical protein VJ737_17280 [Streptomyces sp. CGMCC 4.1772]GHD31815.1 hypothetical protein GCM10010313_75670 [Streptomyces violarus]
MRKYRVARGALAVAGAITLVVAATGSASAADTTLPLKRGGKTIGTMTHLDPDPDTFRVCDTRADGHGVTGKLYLYMAGWQLKETKGDGGDAGCGSFDYNVVPYAAKYLMKLCSNGPGGACVQKEFTED